MKHPTTRTRRRGQPRVPIAYASLLVIALVAIVGFAAFSPSVGSSERTDATIAADTVATSAAQPVSARVASAILAIRVSNPEARTAAPRASETTVEPSTERPNATADTADPSAASTTAAAAPQAPATTAPAEPQSAPADTTPPSFTIASPHDGDSVESKLVTFSGTVEQGASVRSGPYEAQVDDDGTWSLKLTLAPGDNGASFTATDAAGNTATGRIVVTYIPPKTTTTKPAAPTTTKPAAPTTTKPPSSPTTTTTTKATSSSSKWSPNWPADAAGIRDVEAWRPLVAQYWAADRVDCVLGLIKRESRGNPQAYNSSTGASGLLQHLIKYWNGRAASAGFKDSNGLVASPYNAEANIAAAAAIATGSRWWSPWGSLPTYGSCSG